MLEQDLYHPSFFWTWLKNQTKWKSPFSSLSLSKYQFTLRSPLIRYERIELTNITSVIITLIQVWWNEQYNDNLAPVQIKIRVSTYAAQFFENSISDSEIQNYVWPCAYFHHIENPLAVAMTSRRKYLDEISYKWFHRCCQIDLQMKSGISKPNLGWFWNNLSHS